MNDSLSTQIQHLLNTEEVDEKDIAQAMDQYRSKLEELFTKGHLKGKVCKVAVRAFSILRLVKRFAA